MKWIDINDQLPPFDGTPDQVIVCNTFNGMQVVMFAVWNGGVFYNGEFWGNYVEDEDCVPDEIKHVTHWMPLPAPPTAETAEGANLQPLTHAAENGEAPLPAGA